MKALSRDGKRTRVSRSIARVTADIDVRSVICSTPDATDNSVGILFTKLEINILREMAFARLQDVRQFLRDARTVKARQEALCDIMLTQDILDKTHGA